MAVNPLDIIEQQLVFLSERSKTVLLTADETQALTSLVKLQLVLRTRAASSKDNDELYTEISTDDLKQLLALL